MILICNRVSFIMNVMYKIDVKNAIELIGINYYYTKYIGQIDLIIMSVVRITVDFSWCSWMWTQGRK